MTEPMGTHARHAGTLAGPTTDVADQVRSDGPRRRLGDQEHLAQCGRAPGRSEVGAQSLADFGDEWQTVPTTGLASHYDLPCPPVDVVELEPRHLRRAQTETSDEHQHGEIAGTDGAGAVTGIEQPLHLWRGQPGRDTRVVPSGHRRDCRGQRELYLAFQIQEPQ
jgi:hypothetical protein